MTQAKGQNVEKVSSQLKKRLGERIATIRKAKDITQEKLAEMSDISHSTLGYIECGKNYPKPETVAKISKALGIDVYELLTFKNFGNRKEMYTDILKKLAIVKDDDAKVSTIHSFMQNLV